MSEKGTNERCGWRRIIPGRLASSWTVTPTYTPRDFGHLEGVRSNPHPWGRYMLTVTNSLVINHWSLSRLGWSCWSCCGALGMWRGTLRLGMLPPNLETVFHFFRGEVRWFSGGVSVVFYYWGWGEEFWKGAGQGDDFSSFGRDPVVLADLEVLTPICWVLECFGPGVNSVWASTKREGM